jgi:ketosteroid isomerase-like protein
MIGALIAKKKIASAHRSLNNRDIGSFLAGWHDEATWIYPGDLSVSGEFKGKKTIQEWYRKYMDRFTNIKITPKSMCVQNLFDLVGTNVVAVTWDEGATSQDGDTFVFNGVHVINLKSGKAMHVQDYVFDTEEIRKAWGE